MSEDFKLKATLQLPCPAVIISAASAKDRDAMTASAMFVSQLPPLVSISVSRTFGTYQLIEKSGEFVINVISEGQLDIARKVGSTHGIDSDKFATFNIGVEPASRIKAPIIAGCFASLECQVKSHIEETEGNHMIYLAEVVAFKMNDQLRPLVWLNNRYFNVGAECRL